MRGNIKHARPSPAMVVSLVALFATFSGIGYAVKQLPAVRVAKNAVTSKQIKNRSVRPVDVNRKFRIIYLRVSGTQSAAVKSRAQASTRHVYAPTGRSDQGSASATPSIFEPSVEDSAPNDGPQVRVSSGASEPFMSSPPFTFSIGCSPVDSSHMISLLVSSNAGSWTVSSLPTTTVPPDQALQVHAIGIPDGQFKTVDEMALTFVDASNKVTTLSAPSVGVDSKGTCWIQAQGIGPTPTS